MSQVDPDQLAEAISGLTDDQLEETLKQMGPDTVLQQIFEAMPMAFVPDKAQGVTADIQYDIQLNGDVKQWTVHVADGKCTTEEGASSDPRITLALGLTNFVRLIFNQAQGPQLFMAGQLKLQGDMMFAMQMQTFFQRPA